MYVLDYGHGGIIDGMYQTPGKRYTFTDRDFPKTVYEGVMNRRIAAAAARRSARLGDTVIDGLTGQDWDSVAGLEQRDVSLADRVAIAGRWSGLPLASVHCNAVGDVNAGPSIEARGIVVFHGPGMTRAEALARHVAARAVDAGLKVRGVKTAAHTVTKANPLAVLIECGFFVNADEALWLMYGSGAPTVGRVIARAMHTWEESQDSWSN